MAIAGRVALITGASRGLGKAMALALAAEGVRLALVARDVEQLSNVAAEARRLGTEAEVFPADITKEAQVLGLERDVIGKLGPVDILINNAGINVRKDCVDFTLAEWNSVLETNLTSVFLMCRSFVPHMKGRGYGRIVNMTSIMGHISFPQRTVYSATKAGLLGFTKALALELAQEKGITVVGISPGPFATEMTAPIINDPVRNEEFLSRVPQRRWGQPEDVGKLAVFLCSEDASFITGTDILIDGGWCAQ
jgi:NAD(P)-dependent dehydrogenase (short-subunit alcohol dehydrogenase family)